MEQTVLSSIRGRPEIGRIDMARPGSRSRARNHRRHDLDGYLQFSRDVRGENRLDLRVRFDETDEARLPGQAYAQPKRPQECPTIQYARAITRHPGHKLGFKPGPFAVAGQEAPDHVVGPLWRANAP